MLALLFRHGVELTIPGPTNGSREGAGDGALAQIPPQGAVGGPRGPPAPARSWPGISQRLPFPRSTSGSSMPSEASGQLWG